MKLPFKKLRIQQVNSDVEKAHVEADEILCYLPISLGFEDLVKEYRKIVKNRIKTECFHSFGV